MLKSAFGTFLGIALFIGVAFVGCAISLSTNDEAMEMWDRLDRLEEQRR